MKHLKERVGRSSAAQQKLIYRVNSVDPSKLRPGKMVWSKKDNSWVYKDELGQLVEVGSGGGGDWSFVGKELMYDDVAVFMANGSENGGLQMTAISDIAPNVYSEIFYDDRGVEIGWYDGAIDNIDYYFYAGGSDIGLYAEGSSSYSQLALTEDSYAEVLYIASDHRIEVTKVGEGYSISVITPTGTNYIILDILNGIRIDVSGFGNLILEGLPTSDPSVNNAVWNNGGVLNISSVG